MGPVQLSPLAAAASIQFMNHSATVYDTDWRGASASSPEATSGIGSKVRRETGEEQVFQVHYTGQVLSLENRGRFTRSRVTRHLGWTV